MRKLRILALLSFAICSFGLVSETALSANQVPKKTAKKAINTAKKAEAEKKSNQVNDSAPAPVRAGQPTAETLKPAFIGGRKDAAAVTRKINEEIHRYLSAEQVKASPICSDAEFVRRVYLDLTGVIPTAVQAEQFLAITASDKRARLIDELLASPGYGQHQADIWMGLLVKRSSDNRRVDFSTLRTWLANQFNQNRPWNEMVTEMVTAKGNQTESPAVGFFLSNNTVDKMTDEVCKVFLGMQLQCAQCHNHPFTSWKQTEYWAMAGFFMKTQVVGLGKDQTPGVTESQIKRNKKNALPESAKIVPPQFLQGEAPKIHQSEPFRPVLARWMTSPTNPFFAKAMVNRAWAQLFGIGLVNPVDDMHGANDPSHPELLQALAADFAASGFDLKYLIRSICNTDAYQRSSKAIRENEQAEDSLFARKIVKVLSPEQLFDSLAQVTKFDRGHAERGREKNVKGPNVNARERFVQFYLAGADEPNTTQYEAGIPQALKLMNSRVTGNPQVIRELVGTTRGSKAIEKLYLATLSRLPSADEIARVESYVSQTANPLDAYSDVLWALVNSSEFALNR